MCQCIFCNFAIISPWKKEDPSFEQTKFPSPKDDLCKVWLELAKWFWRRRFLKFVKVFPLFRNYLPLEMGGALFEQIWIPFTVWCIVPSFFEVGSVVLEKMIFQIRQMMDFRNFLIISPGKRTEPFIWTNFNLPHPKMICAKCGWNWPSGSGEEFFF